nr:proline-rich extensin-like protein EPR1 [Drosophila suzukii]
MPPESDSDVEIIETESFDCRNHHRRPETLRFPAKMFTQIPPGIPSPPFSPSDPIDMPLLKEALAHNGHLNVPEGFVLCIPCYLCKQPFNDYESLKEHLIQHAAEITSWNTSRAQAQEPQPPPMMKPYVHPVNQPFVHPIEQPMFHPIHQGMGHQLQFHMAMNFGHQPPLDLYSPPLEPPMAYPMPPTHHHPNQIQPPIHYPIQQPLEFPGPGPGPRLLPMPSQFSQEMPVQPQVIKSHLKNPMFPREMHNLFAPETGSPPVEKPPVLVKPKSPDSSPASTPSPAPAPAPDPVSVITKPRSPVLIKPKVPRQSTYLRGQFECDWCGKRLSSRQSLRYHENHFHAEEELPENAVGKEVQKQHRCPTCKKRYKRRTFLLMHMKVKHGIVRSPKSVSETESPSDADAPAPPAEVPVSVSNKSSPTEEPKKEIWSTQIYNAVAAAKYNPASERADKYLSAPRQQTELLESGFKTTPKRTYPLRSPYFNPDLWLGCDAYL